MVTSNPQCQHEQRQIVQYIARHVYCFWSGKLLTQEVYLSIIHTNTYREGATIVQYNWNTTDALSTNFPLPDHTQRYCTMGHTPCTEKKNKTFPVTYDLLPILHTWSHSISMQKAYVNVSLPPPPPPPPLKIVNLHYPPNYNILWNSLLLPSPNYESASIKAC